MSADESAESAPARHRPAVRADVKITPAKRRATYTVPLSEASRDVLRADVMLRDVKLSTLGGYSLSLERSLAHVDAALALLDAVRAELVEQGVTE